MRKSERQLKIEQDFLVAMTDLVMAMRDTLHRMDHIEVSLAGYIGTIKRIESKIDTITKQTIKEEYIEGVEDYEKT